MRGLSRFLDMFRGRFNVPIVFGFSCCLAWFLVALRAVILLSESPDPYSLHVPFYLFTTGAATLSLLFGAVFRTVMARLLSLPAMSFVPAIAVAVTTILALFVAISTEALFAGFLGIVAGAGFAMFLFQWRTLWAGLEFKSIVFNAVATWLLCEVLFFLAVNLDQILASILTALFPIVSLIMLTRAQNTLEPAPPFGSKTERVSWAMVARLACLGFCFSFMNEYVRLTFIQRNFSGLEQMSSLVTNGLSLLILLIVATVSIIIPLFKKIDIRFEVLYRILLILSVMGVLLLLTEENPPTVSYAINMAAFLCLGLTFWAASIGLCRKYPFSGMVIFGFTLAAWTAGPLVSAQLNHVLYEASLLPDTPFIVIVGVCVLMLVYCFIFRETDIADITMEGRTSEFSEKCAQVSWRYHLSDRESEILVHFAKGRNIAWIQNELCLSKSTVSTHRQHIYEKLGIHTKQELIDLVESVDEN